MKKGLTRNPIIILCLHLIWMIILPCFSRTAKSETIWKIGDPEMPNTCDEFMDTDQRIIEYVIPPERNEVWEGFPKFLYPSHEDLEETQEIWIDY